LGTDIVSTNSNNQVWTSLEQRLLGGNVYSSNSSSPLSQGTHTLQNIWWLWHNNTGYLFPTSEQGKHTISISNVQKTANWLDIGVYNLTQTGSVFSANIIQSKPPINGDTYAYIVVPSIPYEEFIEIAKGILANITIVSNTPQNQAVLHNGLDQLQAVFWTPSQINGGSGFNVASNQPVALLITTDKTQVTVTVSNPNQNSLSSVSIQIDRQLQCSACTYNSNTHTTTLLISLSNTGSSMSVTTTEVTNLLDS